MAEGLNKVMLLGNIGAEPELRTTPQGQSVLKLRLATTWNYVDKNQERQEKTEWHSVTIWGKRGEALARILTKGARILVEGRLQTSSYEKDGVKKYRTEVVADDVFFAGGAASARGPSAPSAATRELPHVGSNGAMPRAASANDIPY